MEVVKKIERPNIFEYRDYRCFLGDLYEYYKSTTDFFSFRYFAKRAGFKSPNYLKLVIEGQRNISGESIDKFCYGLKLNKEESEFFSRLVEFNQAPNNSQKAESALRLIQSKIYKKMAPLDEEQLKYYSQWYQVGIRELSLCESFIEDSQWIGQQFTPKIEKSKVDEALDTLTKLGLLGRDENGKLMPTNNNVATANEVTSPLVTLYHKQMMDRAKDSLDLHKGSEREVSSVCVPVSEETFQKMKKRIQEFRKEMMALAENDSSADRVYQMNIQLFPLTKGSNDET
ncbi:MAG: TIGR02147 family protein [Bdellovibrionales bacterium]|nr:TIGR02147 family protein [Bdellovibrionales bacterium]NQZ19700.1 TIGR02147 family protein [Bdellovibrionales bacterium]